MIRIQTFQPGASEARTFYWLADEGRVDIGSGADCRIRMDRDGVPDHAADLLAHDGNLFLAWSGSGGSENNSSEGPVRIREVERGDVVRIGSCRLVIGSEEEAKAGQEETGPAVRLRDADHGSDDESHDRIPLLSGSISQLRETVSSLFRRITRSAFAWRVLFFGTSILIHLVLLWVFAHFYVYQQEVVDSSLSVSLSDPEEDRELDFEEPEKPDVKDPFRENRSEDPDVRTDTDNLLQQNEERENKQKKKKNSGPRRDFQTRSKNSDRVFEKTIGLGGGGKEGGEGGGGSVYGSRQQFGEGGGHSGTDRAVLDGLIWLAKHQSSSGKWDPVTFSKQCPGQGCDNYIIKSNARKEKAQNFRPGVTSLALLAFLGAGFTPASTETHDGINFGSVVEDGLNWLREHQELNGSFTTSDWGSMYNNALSTMALAEAYGMTSDDRFEKPARKGVQFLQNAQNGGAGWRYFYQSGKNDTSVTGWCVMALKSAEIAGLSVREKSYKDAMSFVRRVTHEETGVVGYKHLRKQLRWRRIANIPVGMVVRELVEQDVDDRVLMKHAEQLMRHPPNWQNTNSRNFFYWYYGTLALYMYAGPTSPEPRPDMWEKWNSAMKNVLLKNQDSSGHEEGSWDPSGEWIRHAGRVAATALNTMTLEVYYRYSNAFTGRRPGEDDREHLRKRAKELLKKGKKRIEENDFDRALSALERLIRRYKETPEAQRAKPLRSRAKKLKEARKLWDLGSNYEKNDMNRSALEKYRKLLKKYPDTSYANRAKEAIRRIRGEGK